MQTNVMCSLPRKGKFPDQELCVLLEVPDLAKRPAPRLKRHPFPSPPTGVYRGFMAGSCWLALLIPVGPLLACPAFRLPWRLLHRGRRLWTSLLVFLRTKIFRCFFCMSHYENYGEHKLLYWILG